jgi:hypothetical protein
MDKGAVSIARAILAGDFAGLGQQVAEGGAGGSRSDPHSNATTPHAPSGSLVRQRQFASHRVRGRDLASEAVPGAIARSDS